MTATSASTRENEILALWDRSVGRPRAERDAALLAAAGIDTRATLGAGNAALLRFRTRCFGCVWPLQARCVACGADCDFEADSLEIAQHIENERPAVTTKAERLRPLTFDDLAWVARRADAECPERSLVARALMCDENDLDDVAIANVESAIEALDPGAAVSFALVCPTCARAWRAPVDVCEAVWREIRAAAEKLILEVDALAREYGWRESDVLALSPARRAAYLQLAGAL